MSKLLHRSSWKLIPILGILLAGTHAASGQANLTASRGAEIAPFVQTTLLSPDWGPTKNIGYTIGVDYTRFIRSIVQPSLEFRMTSANGDVVNERTFSGGLKLQATYRRLHPYATLLGGHGDIFFVHPAGNYLSDNSFVLSLGGGADFDVTHQLSVRLDYIHQNWNIGPETLTPVLLGVGVTYRLPFRPIGVR